MHLHVAFAYDNVCVAHILTKFRILDSRFKTFSVISIQENSFYKTEKNNPKHICVNNIHSLEASTYGTYILMVNILHFAQFQETLWTYSVYKIHHACDILAFRYIWSTPSEMCMQFVVWLCAVVVRVCLVLSIPFSVTTPAPGNHAIGSDRALKNMAKQIIM